MRIAIYSRKSKWTGKGESVENQLIMCREYIAMFLEEGDRAQKRYFLCSACVDGVKMLFEAFY